MIKTYEITLDIENDLYTPSNLLFSISNNDFETVELLINIRQDNTNMNLEGTTVELAVKKPSGLTVYQETEIIDPVSGSVRLLLKNQAYLEDGVHTAEVYVRNNDQIAVSCPFYYFSRESIMNNNDEIENINEWSALQHALFAYDLKPVLTDGFPTIDPEYVGQMAFDTTNKRSFIATDLTAASWSGIGSGEGGGGLASWNEIIGKPEVFPADLNDPAIIAALAAKADDSDLAEYLRGAEAAITYQPKGNYLTDIPEEYITNTEMNAALTGKADDSALAAKADQDHTHIIANITGLQTALDSKMDDSEKAALLTEVEGDQRYKALGAPVDPHTHEITEVNGLQPALDSKVDDVDLWGLPTFDDVYVKEETYNKAEVDQMVLGEGGGSPVIVEDNLASSSAANALSANQGKILNTTKASLNHTHTTDQITDFAAGVAANIPAEYLTEAEAGNLHAGKSHIHTYAEITDFAAGVAANIPAEYITTTEADQTYLKTVPAEYLTDVEGNAAYQPKGSYAPDVHTHTAAQITDFAAGVAANIPAEYLTETEGNAAYAKTANVYSKTAVDTSLAGKADKATTLAGYGITDGASDQDLLDHAIYQNGELAKKQDKLWTGTQTAYNALTPDPNTLYFITG